MKNIIIIGSIIFLFTSCRKEVPPVDPSIKDATFSLALAGTMQSKGDGALPTQLGDNTVNSIIVFIFNSASQNIDQMKVATTAEVTAKVVAGSASSGVRDIYVVSNYPSADLTALSAVTSVSSLTAVLANLAQENEGGFRMIGKKLNQTIAASPAVNNTSVIVSRLASRVTLANISTAFTGALVGQSLAIDSIYVLNALGTKSYGDSALIVAPATIYNSTSGSLAFPLFDRYASPISINNTTPYTTSKPNGNHYYVYSNTATTYAGATKMVITGTVLGVRTYYPIAINVAGNGYTPTVPGITANSLYSITVTLRGLGNPIGPGYLDQIQPATVAIAVTPADWHTVINQNIDF